MNITPERLPHLLRMQFVTNNTCCAAAALIDAQVSQIAELKDLLRAAPFRGEREQELAAQNAQLRETLEKLACLGNAGSYGNSIGNCIAQEALALPNISDAEPNARRAAKGDASAGKAD